MLGRDARGPAFATLLDRRAAADLAGRDDLRLAGLRAWRSRTPFRRPISARWRKARRCCTGTPITASARIAARRPTWRGRLAPRMRRLRDAAFSPHRPGGDHARHRRRALPARPAAAVSAQDVFVSRRVPRTRRIDRGRRAPGDRRRGRRRHGLGHVSRLAALAVPGVAHGRLSRRRDLDGHRHRSRGTRGCALVLARRGPVHAGRHAPRRARESARRWRSPTTWCGRGWRQTAKADRVRLGFDPGVGPA